MEDLVMCDDIFFDHIDDLLDFPNDDDLAAMSLMVDPHPPITHHHVDVPPPAISPSLPYETPLLAPTHADAATATATDDKVFDNLDIADIEWFSSFIYDPTDSSSLAFPTPEVDVNHGGDKINSDDMTSDNKYNRTSPDSVLETNSLSNCGFSSSSSSSSCSIDNIGGGRSISERRPALSPYASTYVVVPPTGGRSRYKRPRTTTFSPRTNINASFIPPPPPAVQATVAGPKGFDESTTNAPLTMMMTTNRTNPFAKKKKFNRKNPDDAEESPTAVRKCTHCQMQKTPQWRAGPTGPKTLCNACGVRYKSGRLFPEYRPAASPTFVTAVHSNSHKKVVEMRLKAPVPSPESCDLLEYIRRRE